MGALEFSALVEGLSLDEAYLDVTENAWNEPLGVNVARRIKARIKEMTGLTASAGVAPKRGAGVGCVTPPIST